MQICGILMQLDLFLLKQRLLGVIKLQMALLGLLFLSRVSTNLFTLLFLTLIFIETSMNGEYQDTMDLIFGSTCVEWKMQLRLDIIFYCLFIFALILFILIWLTIPMATILIEVMQVLSTFNSRPLQQLNSWYPIITTHENDQLTTKKEISRSLQFSRIYQ